MMRLCLCAMCALLFACTGSDDKNLYGPEPQITLLSAAPGSVQAFRDTLKFTLQYRDGDGDLGSDNPDDADLFVLDNRLDSAYRQRFRIRQLAPDNANVRITGKLIVPLTNIPLTTGAGGEEKAVFTLYLTDRAGHQSNRVSSPEITIKP